MKGPSPVVLKNIIFTCDWQWPLMFYIEKFHSFIDVYIKKKKKNLSFLLNFLDFSGDFKNFSKFSWILGIFPEISLISGFCSFDTHLPLFLLRARHFRCGDVLARAKKFQK